MQNSLSEKMSKIANKAKWLLVAPALLLTLEGKAQAQEKDTLQQPTMEVMQPDTFQYNNRTYQMYEWLNSFVFEISGYDKLDNSVLEKLESLRNHLNGLPKLGWSGPQFLAKKSLISLNFAKNPVITIIISDEQGVENEKIVLEDGTKEDNQKLQQLLAKQAELAEQMKTAKKSKQEKLAQEMDILEDEIDEIKKAQQTAVDKLIAYFSKPNVRAVDEVQCDYIKFVRSEVGKLDMEDDTTDASKKESIYEPMPRLFKCTIFLAY